MHLAVHMHHLQLPDVGGGISSDMLHVLSCVLMKAGSWYPIIQLQICGAILALHAATSS